ncbi:unnamed protein product [Laminaria digitata]
MRKEFLWSFLGGSFAGLCQAVVTIPTDNVKVKLQVSWRLSIRYGTVRYGMARYCMVRYGTVRYANLHFAGPVDCAFKLVKAHGIGALFRGTPVTLARDTPSMGLYFASYEGVKGWLERRWGLGEMASSCGAGGFAGALSWVVIYPLDVVKSVQMVR